MKFTQYLAVNVLLVLLSLLTVLADSTTTASNNKQHTTLHHNHHHHQRQHLTHKLRHHMLANGGRQVKKLDLNSPQIYAATLTSRGVQRTSKDVETVDEGGVKNKPKNLTFTAASAAATRLRRISPRNYYNKVLQTHVNVRRHNNNNNVGNDWAYNSYNIFTNTFGAPVSSHAGKGDDNTDDVEFISASGNRHLPDWSRRSFGGAVPPIVPTRQPITTSTTTTTTMAPPVLVPARRGYNSITNSISGDSVTTEDPFESNSVHRNPGSIDPKEMERRHICVQQRTITIPEKKTEVYTRPVLRHISTPCQSQTHPNQMCTRVQVMHEPAFRDVIRHKSAQQVTYDCCNGWTRESPNADACLKPVCSTACYNGGICSAPDTCSCPTGFTGRYCEQDINECNDKKPCDQMCVNTMGSYYCKCREGFLLQDDQQSCKKIGDLLSQGSHDDDAFEARDMENEIESQEDVTARLQKIEKMLANEKVHTHDLEKTLQNTYKMVDILKSRLINLEKQQFDINRLQTNLYNTETRTLKLEGMVNLLMKCRNGPNTHCP
ncbi:epidermal growth factor-like protein slowdown isoform 1-T3 [Glossina fuscipes fuscipes]